jgi:hypothetical protein
MKAITNNITVSDQNKEAVAFAENIDFTELFDHIQEFTGVSCSFSQPKIGSKHDNVYIAFKSDDIVSQAGPFSAILKRCHIHSFNSGVEIDRKTGKFQYWVVTGIRYEHIDSGSNGMGLLRAWYRSGEWTFLDAGSGG